MGLLLCDSGSGVTVLLVIGILVFPWKPFTKPLISKLWLVFKHCDLLVLLNS